MDINPQDLSKDERKEESSKDINKERLPLKPSRKELIGILDDMIERIEQMPPQALVISINHYDWLSMLLLFSSLFKSSLDSEGDS